MYISLKYSYLPHQNITWIIDTVKCFDTSKATGSDGFPANFVKNSSWCNYHLTYVIKYDLTKGTIMENAKALFVRPIFNKNGITEMGN